MAFLYFHKFVILKLIHENCNSLLSHVRWSGVVATELGLELARQGHEVHFITYSQPVRLAVKSKCALS
jgi:hypothetical protein